MISGMKWSSQMCRPLLGLDAFDGNARPHDLGQAVDVDGMQVELGLDLAAHRLGPGLGAEDADPQLQVA